MTRSRRHGPRRPLPSGMTTRRYAGRTSRSELLAEREELIGQKEQIDAEQQRLAQHLAEVNGRLRELREVLWPAEKYRLGWFVKRPPIGGPPPIPQPCADAWPLRGPELRYAALAVLVRTGRPVELTEIHRAIVLAGYRVDSPNPVKALADSLGYEARRGTSIRVERGVYRCGQLSPGQRRRVAKGLPLRQSHPIVYRPGGQDQPSLFDGSGRPAFESETRNLGSPTDGNADPGDWLSYGTGP